MPQTMHVRCHKAIWETTGFEVEVPDGTDPVEYVRDNLDDLREAAVAADRADVDCGDTVPGMADEVDLYDAEGRLFYRGEL